TKADLEAVEHRLDLKISDVKTELEGVEHRLELKIGEAKADIRVVKWMMGFILAFQVAIFVKLFLP
ncbi:MAG: hypothetical protein HYZ60_06440, partial [Methylocystis sp.]|nr:hypothetical protein [Methylocystis sp.]